MPDALLLKIPTTRIRPNPKQPRHFLPPDKVEAMAASLKQIGQQTPAKVRPLTETEKIQTPDHDYELIGGHIRHAGSLKAGLSSLDCLVLDLSPEQAELAGLLDNQSTEMHWLDWVLAVERLSESAANPTQQQMADQLGFTQARINYALKVAKTLTPESRDLIYKQVIKLGPENTVSERSVMALAGLEDPQLAEKVLPVLLDRQLTEGQAKKLVEWVKAGNPVDTFNHQAAPKAPKTPKARVTEAPSESNAAPAAAESPKSAKTVGPVKPQQTSPDTPMSETESLAWGAAVGISVISRIKAKIKKGERPNLFEVLLLAGHYVLRALAWVVKHGGKLLLHASKMIWKVFKESLQSGLKALGPTIYRVTRTLLGLAFLAVCAYVAWESYAHGFHPLHALGTLFTLVIALVRG